MTQPKTFYTEQAERGWPCPGWTPKPRHKPKGGDGSRRRFKDGTSKKGWGPITQGPRRSDGRWTKPEAQP